MSPITYGYKHLLDAIDYRINGDRPYMFRFLTISIDVIFIDTISIDVIFIDIIPIDVISINIFAMIRIY